MPDPTLTTRTIIGLEIHVQLATASKLFCGCAVEFAAQPNSRVCPVCLGLPGALPVMNRQAVRLAVAAGMALNCRIAPFTKWDRKSYYYPDLPKNYQISQYDLPLCSQGYFDIPAEPEQRRIRILRAHLEEDAGKNVHDTPGCTLVDLNRTGTPLLEIVTEPDLASADETYAFAVELQRLVTYLGVSEGSMQKGQMRFEPNVNVAIVRDGVEYRTPISEIKNLNSFKALRSAIRYEAERQVQDWLADPGYLQRERPNENRGWNDARGVTELQRAKEEAHDYRYFPDPDLVPVELDNAWLDETRVSVPELPLARRARLVEAAGLSPEDAATIVEDRTTADLFEGALADGASAAVLTKQLINVWAKLAGERDRSIAELAVGPERMAALARLVEAGTISATAAKQIAGRMLDAPDSPEALAESMGLVQVDDADAIGRWVDEALLANEKAVQTVLTNPKKAQASEGFLRGQVMRLSGGKADPRRAGELIAERIAQLRAGGSGEVNAARPHMDESS
ncbi:MAG: Asp-tRNA(Asn)/Glu-tRNA(Gln) amidotransferase subunit GatB [bacterium]|nr:Asp-tRNA(Asn)/Glu-tRNA(Gln) amidotransferase subunit GatB [bacterium]